jgi:hypothetical protein
MACDVNFKLLQHNTDSTIFIFQAKLTGLCGIWCVDWQLHISLNNVENTFVYFENYEHKNAARLSHDVGSVWSKDTRRITRFQTCAIFESKKLKKKSFWNARRVLLRGNEVQWDVNIVMGDDAGRGPIMQRPIGFQCVWVWISTGSSGIYVYILPYVYWILTCVTFRSFTTA